ncbi:unnamed protein product [Linum tenue]|uniref:Protein DETOXIFICATION n=1 Tax=Linum tenue TaxID=586396 RepID=A0AAV0JEN6_9ROSI|nr:unnamed protein product [Linum tenue]
MSTTRQFGSGTLSGVVTGRTKFTKNRCSWARCSRVPTGFQWRDSTTECCLFTKYRSSLSPLVTCRRRPQLGVVYNQSTPGYGVESADVQERLDMEKEHAVNGSAHEQFDSVGFSVEKKHQPTDVKRELTMLTVPAIAGQAIDPFAQLMETAFIGRLGPIELGSAGVATMIFNNISKLFNIPLLSVATSFVAEDIAKNAVMDSTVVGAEEDHTNGKVVNRVVKRKQLASVSTALLLAIGIGVFEATALSLGCGPFLNLMGVTSDSPMRVPAQKFLSIKALGAPAVVLSLALQGIFRGFKDMKTPVICLGKYLVTILMLWHLNEKVVLLPPRMADLQFGVYMKSGGFLIGRTLAVLITMTLATAMAARQGPVAMAGHQICMQVWLAVSLLTDALASSGQALIASYSSKRDYVNVKEVTNLVLKVGLVTGISLAAILSVSFGSIATLFTTDAEVLGIAKTGILMLVGALSSVFLLYVPPITGLPGVWSGLALFMALRTAAGIARLLLKSGPWWFLHKDLQNYQAG